MKNNKHQARIIAAKSGPCLDCGGVFHWSAMEFDHVRGEKHHAVGRMRSYSWARIEDEIAKCEVVCSNCHAVRTFKRLSEKHERREARAPKPAPPAKQRSVRGADTLESLTRSIKAAKIMARKLERRMWHAK